MTTCPLCSEQVSDVRAHCEEAHEEEMRQRRLNPADPVVLALWPVITTTRAGLTYRAEMGERHVTVIGESADESTNHLRAARELRRDLGLSGGLHGRVEGDGRMSWSVGWVRRS